MAQLSDGLMNVVYSSVGILLFKAEPILLSEDFLKRADVNEPVVKELGEFGHVSVDKSTVVSNRVANQNDSVF